MTLTFVKPEHLEVVASKIESLVSEFSEVGLPKYSLVSKMLRSVDNIPDIELQSGSVILQITTMVKDTGLTINDELITVSVLNESLEDPVIVDNLEYDDSTWQFLKTSLLEFLETNKIESCPVPLLLMYLFGAESPLDIIVNFSDKGVIRIDDVLLNTLLNIA